MACRCSTCTYLYVWPEMPYMDPPSLADVWSDRSAEWSVACNWLGPLIDGWATLIRKEFKTDGGSIPPVAWPLVGHPFQMPHLPYFLQHDADCAAELFGIEIADQRLHKGMDMDGHISSATRHAIYLSVRDYHAVAKSDHTPASVATARRFCAVVDESQYRALRVSRLMPDLFPVAGAAGSTQPTKDTHHD